MKARIFIYDLSSSPRPTTRFGRPESIRVKIGWWPSAGPLLGAAEFFGARGRPAGFSLTELLAVLAITAIMAAASIPVVGGLLGSGTVDQAAQDISNTLQQARAYAMANNTYVRVGFATLPASTSTPLPSLVVLCLYSSDGTLSTTEESDMTSSAEWPAVGIPLKLSNFSFSDSLGTTTDVTPDSTDIGHFTRSVGGLGPVSFNACIQFAPTGTAQVSVSSPARVIKVPVDRPAPLAGKNPFVIRLEGLTGATEILRKENL